MDQNKTLLETLENITIHLGLIKALNQPISKNQNHETSKILLLKCKDQFDDLMKMTMVENEEEPKLVTSSSSSSSSSSPILIKDDDEHEHVELINYHHKKGLDDGLEDYIVEYESFKGKLSDLKKYCETIRITIDSNVNLKELKKCSLCEDVKEYSHFMRKTSKEDKKDVSIMNACKTCHGRISTYFNSKKLSNKRKDNHDNTLSDIPDECPDCQFKFKSQLSNRRYTYRSHKVNACKKGLMTKDEFDSKYPPTKKRKVVEVK